MMGYLVLCKEGVAYPRWAPMGLTEIDSNFHLTSDEPWSLFRTEEKAHKWMVDAAAYHEDEINNYQIEEIEIS